MLRKLYNKWKMNGLKAKELARFPTLVLDERQARDLEHSMGWLAIKQQLVHSIDQCYDKLKTPMLTEIERAVWTGRLTALETVYGIDRHIQVITTSEYLEMAEEDAEAMMRLTGILREVLSEN